MMRQFAGERVLVDEISASHADLMPELREALRRAEMIGSARDRARRQSSAGFAPAGYDLVREIRRGGQGVVFEAVQRSTGRTVAIKWMRDGSFAGPADRMRFEREVQILAQLNHPNIITIHDSGVTPAGDHYFVMNYVEGMPLDEYIERMSNAVDQPAAVADADRTQTHAGAAGARVPLCRHTGITGADGIRTGLRLMRTVCDAVHTAHLRGIIHRDLKPSNIRVDSRGEPHVLDFGLAKLSDAQAGAVGATEFTQSGQFVGSLPWASPEQVEGRSDLTDIRTDVYSLGVVLFQMLTGRFPYPVLGHIREVMDHITHTEPARPRSLRADLDDEIETIVLKCLAKEPDRRYQSAGELARDIDRYLAGDAIEAKRDSIHYVLRKQLRRYRLPLGIAAAFLLLLFAGFGTSIYLWREALDEGNRARNAEIRAEIALAAEAEQRRLADASADKALLEAEEKSAINRFLQAILAAADPRDARDRNITVRTALDEAANKLERPENAQSPRIEAAIRTTLGQTYRSLGEYAVAEGQLRRAVALYERADPTSLDAANALNVLGLVLVDLDRPQEAIDYLQRAVAIARALPGQEVEHAVLLNSLANALYELERYDDAESGYREALAIQRERLGDVHVNVAESLDNLGMLLTQKSRYDEAEPLLREALSIQRQLLDRHHPHLATTLSNLADVLCGRREPAEAEALFREALDIRLAVLGDSHPHVAVTLSRLAQVSRDRHQLPQAEEWLRQALAIRRKTPEEGWRPLVANLCNLADLLADSNRLDEAEALYREALDIRRERLGPDHVDTAEVMNNLAGVLLDREAVDDALQLYRGAFQILERVLPTDDFRICASKNNIANVLRRQKKYDEAEPLHREVLAMLEAQYPQGHPYVARSMCNLANTLAAQQKTDAAVTMYVSAIDMLRRLHQPREHFDTADALGDLAAVQTSAGRHADAEVSLREAIAIIENIMPEQHPARLAATSRLAECVARQGKFDDAEQLWSRIVDQMEENPAITPQQRSGMIEHIAKTYEDAGRADDAGRWRSRM